MWRLPHVRRAKGPPGVGRRQPYPAAIPSSSPDCLTLSIRLLGPSKLPCRIPTVRQFCPIIFGNQRCRNRLSGLPAAGSPHFHHPTPERPLHLKPTVFIHTNHKQIAGAIVSAHSLRRASATPDAFDVKIIDTRDYPYFREYDGKNYLRDGQQRPWLFEDLQSFTPSRFMPPELMGYEGRAIVVDPDIFAVADIMELFNFDMKDKSVILYQRPRPDGGIDFMTSCMLMDCAKLKHWNVEESFKKMFTNEVDYDDWLNLKLEDPNTIGELPPVWNHFDTLTPETKMLHTTHRRTQPWKTGLPVDFKLEMQPAYKRKLIDLQRAIFGKPIICKRYKVHPDPRQERLFFGLLKECLANGEITKEQLQEEMKQDHVRHDAFKVMEQIKPLPPRDRMNEFFQ